MSRTCCSPALNNCQRRADREDAGRLEDYPIGVAAVLTALCVAPVAALFVVGTRGIAIEPGVHFAVVCTTALVAFQAAIALSLVGFRRRDGRAVMIGTAFVVMAALLAIHGFATPGVLIGANGLVALAAGITLPAGAILIGLSAHPIVRHRDAVGRLICIQALLVAAIAALGAIGIALPESLPAAPLPDSTAALALLGLGSLMFAALALRSLRTYRLTRRYADAMVGVGVIWLAAALGAAATFGTTEFGWWLGHGFELAGIAIVTLAVAVDLRNAAPPRALTGDLAAAELVQAEEAYLGPQIRGLLVRLADKDQHTEQHARRVAMRAAQVGEELRFTPSALRDLAVGGLLHDIGKLSIPRSILQKPGKLTDAEYLQIQRHPELGARILTQLGGFSVGVVTLVADHHERLDGTGYPYRLSGEELSDAARILGVCDVYDALISTRVYRAAWTDSDAIRYLQEDAAVQFDQRVVDALALVLERETISDSVGRLSPHPAEARLQRRTTRGAWSPKRRATR